MTMDRIEAAIGRVCQEIVSQLSPATEWQERTEQDVYREVVACILGSRVSFEVALAATDALAEDGLLRDFGDEKAYAKRVIGVLSQPLFRPEWPKCRRYRFPQARGQAIARTAAAFYADGGSVKDWLSGFHDALSARRHLVEKAKGVGPKQASMVLRNVGFSDELAILDSHLLRFMGMKGLLPGKASFVATLKGYEIAERKFLAYSSEMGWPTGILDQAVWIVMRVYLREAR